MDIIVLVKFVADIENIPEDAWDKENGTLLRGKLQMVANPLDDRALEMAFFFRKNSGGRVFVVSMGPPSAEEVCRRAIAYGADKAILVSDPSFGGADTIATARTLAAAIKKIVDEFNLSSPLVIAGMQSPDGDTAQVPLQVAEFLKFPVLPYVSSFSYQNNDFFIETLQPIGRREFKLSRVPAMLTVTNFVPTLPFFTQLEKMAEAAETTVEIWNNEKIGVDKKHIGLNGSYTRVVKIFSPEDNGRTGLAIDFSEEEILKIKIPEMLSKIENFLKTGEKNSGNKILEANKISTSEPHYNGDVAVFCELENKNIVGGSLELLGQARLLAEKLGSKSVALVVSEKISLEMISELESAGAEKIIHISQSTSDHFIVEEYSEALISAIKSNAPQIVLVSATLAGRVIAPLVAARLEAGLTADCTGLEISDFSTNFKGEKIHLGKILHQTRPALGGNIMATIVALRGKENGAPQMATVRPGVFPKQVFATQNISPTKLIPQKNPSKDHFSLVVKENEKQEQLDKISLDECEVIVCVGVGIGDKSNLEKLAIPLSEAIANKWGVKTGLACTRAAMEAGFLPYSNQVGQTGKVVKPPIYIAIGVSGAIQHQIGMENSGMIISINPDEDAPIKNVSDYYLKAGIEEAIPVIIKALTQ